LCISGVNRCSQREEYAPENKRIMDARALRALIFFIAGTAVYAVIIVLFAIIFDGRGGDRTRPLLYTLELLPLISLLLLSFFVGYGDTEKKS